MKKFKVRYKRKKYSKYYSGSLVQQNFGESMEKGYLLWDIRSSNDFDVEFRQVPNDYAYYTLYSKEDKLPDLDLPSKCRIRVIWEKAAKDISRAETTRVTGMIYKKYNPLSVQLTFKPIDNDKSFSVDVDQSDNLADPSVQRDLLKQWLVDRCETDEEVESILTIDREVGENVMDTTQEDFKNSTWSLKGLTLENFMSYVGPYEIDFENLKGVIGLFGDNAVGKSVILDAILYALFNKTSRNVKNEDLVNKKTDNQVCKVVLDIEIRGVDYRIERWTTRQYKKRTNEFVNARTDVVFQRKYHGDDEWENLSETQRNETEKIIRNAIGSFDDFLITTLSTQNQIDRLEANEFLSLRPALRSDYMLRFLGLDIFNKKYDYAKDLLRSIDRDRNRKDEEEEVRLLQERQNQLNTTNHDIKVYEDELSMIDDQIEKSRREIYEYQSLINDTIKIDKDVDSLREEQNEILCDMNNMELEIENTSSKLNKLVHKMEKIENMYIMDNDELSKWYAKVDKAEALKEKIRTIGSEIESDKKVLRIYREDMSSENTCPVVYDENHLKCSYLKGYVKKKEMCEELISEVRRKIEEKSNFEDRLEEIKSCYSVVEEQENIRNALSSATFRTQELIQTKVELENKLEMKKMSLSLVNSHLEIAEKNEETIKKNKHYRGKIKDKEDGVENNIREKKRLNDKLIKLGNDKAVLERDIENIEYAIEEIRSNDEKFKLYNTYCNSMHRTGLPVEVLRSYIPKINYEINKILSDVVGFGLFFKIDQDSTDINIVMRYDGDVDDTRPASMASGMERLLINFAIRYALISVSNLNKPSVWMIDEGFGVLDGENLYSMGKFFENIRGMFKNVIMITHLDSLKDIANWVVSIDKTNGISRLNPPQKNI